MSRRGVLVSGRDVVVRERRGDGEWKKRCVDKGKMERGKEIVERRRFQILGNEAGTSHLGEEPEFAEPIIYRGS